MYEFEIIDLENKKKWEEIADKTVEIYDKWQYVSAFYKNGDGIPYMAYLQGNNGIIYNVYIKRKVENTKNCSLFDITTPYGYGGVKIKGTITELEKNIFFKEFENYCKKNNIVSEFIRLNPLQNNYCNYNSKQYDITKISKTVYIKLESKEQIWQDMKGNCRTAIRKAINNQLEVLRGFNKKMMQEFKEIYEETMQRNAANSYYYFNASFFDDMKKNMSNNAKIYTAYIEGKPISTSIVIYSGENAHYHLSGTLSKYMNLGASNLILYKIALDMQEEGYKKFHLGGGYGGDQSPLLKFKQSFNKNGELDFYIGKKIWNQKIYNELCEAKNIDTNVDFFPAYRKEYEK